MEYKVIEEEKPNSEMKKKVNRSRYQVNNMDNVPDDYKMYM